MKSISSVKQSEIQQKWYLIDATGQRIGTLASKVAQLLIGKNDPKMRPYHKPMAKVVVVNAGKIDFTFKRGMTKFYKSYSGYPDGLSFSSLENTFKKFPTRPLENAIKGMLPKTKRGDLMLGNLRVYADNTHPHEAQKFEVIDVKNFKI